MSLHFHQSNHIYIAIITFQDPLIMSHSFVLFQHPLFSENESTVMAERGCVHGKGSETTDLIPANHLFYCTKVKCLKQVLLRRVILFSLNFWQKAGRPAKIGSRCQSGCGAGGCATERPGSQRSSPAPRRGRGCRARPSTRGKRSTTRRRLVILLFI